MIEIASMMEEHILGNLGGGERENNLVFQEEKLLFSVACRSTVMESEFAFECKCTDAVASMCRYFFELYLYLYDSVCS